MWHKGKENSSIPERNISRKKGRERLCCILLWKGSSDSGWVNNEKQQLLATAPLHFTIYYSKVNSTPVLYHSQEPVQRFLIQTRKQ